jgi:hypothetical protein
MRQLIIRVQDDENFDRIVDFLSGIPNVETQSDDTIKIWDGKLSGFEHPIHVENYRVFSREELYDRQGIY